VRFCPDDGTPITMTTARAATPTGVAAAVEVLQLPAVLGNRYRLESLLGGGGMAKVYLAVDLTLEREVAIKVMNAELREDPDFDARFQREARIASQLSNPCIVVVHDFGLDPVHGPYLVMEYLRGQSLRHRLQAAGPLPLPAALQLGGQLLLALVHAHEKGIVHRDIKPDNVFIVSQVGLGMQIRVLDFGIARMVHRPSSETSETLTKPGAIIGTPRYMSPEQLAGQHVDARSDLYSAALVIYESLTNSLPFASKQKLIETCPEIPRAAESVLNACLQPNPAERPERALDVYRRLQEICAASGIQAFGPGETDGIGGIADAEATTIVYPSWRAKIRRRLLLGAGATVLLGLCTWGFFAIFPLSSGGESAAKETLLGMAVGDSRDDFVAKFGKPENHSTGMPWRFNSEALGLVVQPKDLTSDGVWDEYDTLTWSHGQICGVFKNNVAQAMVIRQHARGGSGRGLRFGDNEGKTEDLYPEEKPDITFADAPATTGRSRSSAKRIKIYRFNKLGVGFEGRDHKVTSMSIFPPKPD
jgi:hypothetical protein